MVHATRASARVRDEWTTSFLKTVRVSFRLFESEDFPAWQLGLGSLAGTQLERSTDKGLSHGPMVPLMTERSGLRL